MRLIYRKKECNNDSLTKPEEFNFPKAKLGRHKKGAINNFFLILCIVEIKDFIFVVEYNSVCERLIASGVQIDR